MQSTASSRTSSRAAAVPLPSPRPHHRRSIRRRFLWALAAFVAISMALLGFSLTFLQRQLLSERLEKDTRDLAEVLTQKGHSYASFLARIAPQAILSYDYLLLEDYVEELAEDADIVYAVILSPEGHPLTHFLKANTDAHRAHRERVAAQHFEAALTAARGTPGLLVVRRGISHDGANLGTVEVGLSPERIAAKVQELKRKQAGELRRVALLTGIAILFALGVLVWLVEAVFRRMVVRPVQALGAAMAAVPAGHLKARAPVMREDELGRLAGSFNEMADKLEDQLTRLEEQGRAYKETRDYLANILDNSADMIVTTALDGSIVEFNTAAERILGHRRSDVVGQRSDLLYCNTVERDGLYEAVQQGTAVQDAEIALKRSDGAPIEVQVTLSPLRDNAGRIIGTVCIGRDITQAKAMRHQLIQAEKLASVGQVASWIAHQIRNYLGRLLLDASALRPADTAEPSGRAYRDLTAAVQEMDHMVTDLLDYSRTLKLHLAPVKLAPCLEGLLASLVGAPPPGLRVETDFAPDLPPVDADLFKLEQAFGNVIKNALEAMPEGGTLRVRTRAGPQPGQARVTFEDSGPGIPPEDLPQVLRPFFTTKPGGTGLGLAMVARIVEAHGGTVALESPAGRGTTVHIALPCATAKAAHP
jgi:PAS domain S-box-containing protein